MGKAPIESCVRYDNESAHNIAQQLYVYSFAPKCHLHAIHIMNDTIHSLNKPIEATRRRMVFYDFMSRIIKI